MAREARYVLIDDIDGSPAKETVRFAIGPNSFEIDLKEQHLEEFDKDMAKWVQHARALPARRGEAGAATDGVNDAPLIRAWAKAEGVPVSARGRIPDAVRERYYVEMFRLETIGSDYNEPESVVGSTSYGKVGK